MVDERSWTLHKPSWVVAEPAWSVGISARNVHEPSWAGCRLTQPPLHYSPSPASRTSGR
jgi:hypothetical protein